MATKINPDKCIACTICQVYCPVANATPNFLGPRIIGPAYERFRLLGFAEDESLDYCANCKNCDIACPHGVPISTFNMMARCKDAKKKSFSPRNWVLGHGGLLAKVFQLIPAPLKNFGMLNPVSRLAFDAIGISKKASMPKFDKYFRQVVKSVKQPELAKTIVLFPGCYIDAYDHQTGLDIIWILNKAGYKVVVPSEFGCCGLPAVSNGFIDDAKQNALSNLKAIKKYSEQGVPIVTGCPSCSLMLKKDLPEYFEDLKDVHLAENVEFLSVFLKKLIDDKELTLDLKQDSTALYHAPCHLRAAGIGSPSVDLIKGAGVEMENAGAGCCGISGSYGFKKEKYDIGMKIGSELFAKVKSSDKDYITTECGTCRVQIEHGSGKKAIHPVSLIRKLSK